MLRLVLVAYGALSVIGGALWIAIPGTLLDFFGAGLSGAALTLFASLFGAAVLGLGVMACMARDADAAPGRYAMVLGITMVNLLWAVFMVAAAMGDEFNSLAWAPAIGYVLWTVLFMAALRQGERAPATTSPGGTS